MSPLWDNLYCRAKDRRYGSLFLFALLGIFGLLLGSAIFRDVFSGADDVTREWVGVIVALLLVFAITRGFIGFVRARRNRGSVIKKSPLSSDELAKARSKLVQNRDRRSL